MDSTPSRAMSFHPSCPCLSCKSARGRTSSSPASPPKTSGTRIITQICVASAVFGALSPVLLPLGRFALRTTWQQSNLTLRALPGTASQALSLAGHALYAAFGVGVGLAGLVGFECSVTVVTLGLEQTKALLLDQYRRNLDTEAVSRRDAAPSPACISPTPPAVTYRSSDIDYNEDLPSRSGFIVDTGVLPRSGDIDYDDVPHLPSIPYPHDRRRSVYDIPPPYPTSDADDFRVTDSYWDALTETLTYDLLSSMAYTAPRFRMCSHVFDDPNDPNTEETSASDLRGTPGDRSAKPSKNSKNTSKKKSRRSGRSA